MSLFFRFSKYSVNEGHQFFEKNQSSLLATVIISLLKIFICQFRKFHML